MWSIFAVTATSAFSASPGMLSGPDALPLLICLMAMLISSIVGGPTSIGRSVGATSMLGGLITATSAFSASPGMLTGPAALPLLICLMAMLISSVVDGPTSIGRSVGATSMLGGLSGTGRFENSLKCSTHLFRCSSRLVITSPPLLFTGRSGLR
ncbi:unnamed protein product [Schistosoma mattheei]|uniref:Uncharacterized protein n=1 Tax=Schistosoma mattheei TaxID=31246 RepID=A0A183Q500_9TREM|nr:unnamed protein product [Schistosoma mattheei]